MIYLAILISALLYRVPRGGPSGFLPSSALGSGIWAVASGLMLAYATGVWWPVGIAVALLMFLGEMPGYMKHVSETSVDMRRLTLRGLLLLNPLMGVIYEGARRYTKGWPTFGRWIDGWTAYAEVACGLVTASVFALALQLLV